MVRMSYEAETPQAHALSSKLLYHPNSSMPHALSSKLLYASVSCSVSVAVCVCVSKCVRVAFCTSERVGTQGFSRHYTMIYLQQVLHHHLCQRHSVGGLLQGVTGGRWWVWVCVGWLCDIFGAPPGVETR